MIKPKEVSVSAAIIYKEDKVLITRRSVGEKLTGYWEFAGRENEAEETIEECSIYSPPLNQSERIGLDT